MTIGSKCEFAKSSVIITFLLSLIFAEAKPPNVVVILTDDQGYADISFNPDHPKEVATPHMDAQAREGVYFSQAYTSGAVCSPTRAGLMLGLYQQRLGIYTAGDGGRGFDPRTKIFPSFLPDEYTSMVVGKWHMGLDTDYPKLSMHALNRGFDECYKFMGRGGHDYFKLQGVKGTDYAPIYRNKTRLKDSDYSGYLTTRFTEEAVAFIERQEQKPFFLYLAYNAVHSPLQGADAYMKKFAHIEDIQRRIFAAMLAHLDDSVGAVLAELRKQGLEKNTLVIFLSDNGGPTRELTSSNAPLRDGKGSVYEGGLRVPFMMQWPGTLPAGEVYRQPVISLDLFATAAAIAQAPLKRQIDGVNLVPYLTGKQTGAPHTSLYWRIANKAAYRKGDWKLLRNPRRDQSDAWELYNLAEDLAETKNLAANRTDKLEELRDEWDQLNTQMIEPIWTRPRR